MKTTAVTHGSVTVNNGFVFNRLRISLSNLLLSVVAAAFLMLAYDSNQKLGRLRIRYSSLEQELTQYRAISPTEFASKVVSQLNTIAQVEVYSSKFYPMEDTYRLAISWTNVVTKRTDGQKVVFTREGDRYIGHIYLKPFATILSDGVVEPLSISIPIE